MSTATTSNNVTAITIIKAHSLRVPGKNFRPLGGRPLYRWILDALLDCPGINQVVIDTDARQELEAHGLPEDPRIVLRERPESLLGDHVTANALLDAILPAFPSSTYVMVHATSPFVTPTTIRRGIASYEAARDSGRADSLVSVTRYQSRFYRADGSPVNHDLEHLQPTQDLEPWFEENSA